MLPLLIFIFCSFFFFNVPATTEIYTLSLHDALPIYHAAAGSRCRAPAPPQGDARRRRWPAAPGRPPAGGVRRSEEHTSELQSRLHLVCRLLLEKKKKKKETIQHNRRKKILYNQHITR